MSQENSIDQLKYFLKEMFQFNANDLDFGIYRIYNLKRKEIENFIDGSDEQCLEPIINETLDQVKNIERSVELASLHTYLAKLNQQDLLSHVEENYEQLKLFVQANKDDKEKGELLNILESATKEFNITDEIKDKIYNHILGFFEMYYSNGDFGYNNRSRNLYKIPYEADYDGSDTMFHWKHKGSLYIKTGASFNAVKFKLKHLDQEFELRLETNEESKEEDTARNSNKDTKLKHYKFNRFEVVDRVTRLIFNLSDSSTTKADLFKDIFKCVFQSDVELDKYLFAADSKGHLKPVFNDLIDDYDKVLEGSVKGIGALRINRKTLLNKINKNFERGGKIEIISTDGQEHFSDATLETLYNIDQKLNSFYIGNDSDYFIHENLQEFLSQEKERYIKNHILGDLTSILDGKLDNTTIIIAKAFDLVSSCIIEFLSTIEEFQKKLFSMNKKVVESEYCLTIDNIDEKYYDEILKNKAQLIAWENLFSFKVTSVAELKAQPTLVLDTKFFRQQDGSNSFKDKILAEIDNLDERINGLLINSENYQALTLLEEKYRGAIKCIYIDPPYNSKSTSIIYKNFFKHSSWASLMANRLVIGKKLLSPNGVLIVAIDENEQENLGQILSEQFPAHEKTCVSVIHNPGGIQGDNFSYNHEYAYFVYPKGGKIIGLEAREIEDADVRPLRDVSKGDHLRIDAANCFFPIYVKNQKVIGFGDVCADDFHPSSANVLRKDGIMEIYPIDAQGEERKWVFARQTVESIKGELAVEFNKKRKVWDIIRTKMMFNFKTVWDDKKYNANSYGSKLLNNIIGEKKFSFPKSVYTVLDSVRAGSYQGEKGFVLDYFAGSGTTGHSVIKLNKEDDNFNLKYILTEMGTYFEPVTKTRILKVIFSQKWKDMKPEDNDGSLKHIFKNIVLEQYEDVLDAIESFEGEMPKNLPLKYLYKPELNKINSTLNLNRPFSNKIRYGQPTKEGFVDLVETYNYLQGYDIKSIKTYMISKKYYKVVETPDTLVIWRDITLGDDDSKAVIEIAEKYPNATQLDINYEFNILATHPGGHPK
ncbi:MAG: DNA methyltransferase, partial [Smithellaceae bacterium]